jgi:sodium transport system permease protein
VNTVLHVYRKEMRDMLRDKRTRFGAFVMPVLLMMVMVGVLGVVTTAVSTAKAEKVHLVTGGGPLAALLKAQKADVVEVPDVATGEKWIREGKARVVLNPLPLKPDGQAEIDAYLDPKEQRSQIELAAIQKVFDGQNKAALDRVLESKGLPASSAEAFKVVEKDVQVGAKGGAGDLILGLLPYLIVIWAFYGGMSIASDLVAGEKEKNTLETLLISPAVRTQVVLGKFFALATVCLASSLASFVGIGLCSTLKTPGSEVLFKGGLGINPTSFLVTLAVLVPLVAFFASVLLAISTWARNMRECQTYLAQFSFIVMLPAICSQFIGLTDSANSMWVNFVPVLNTANDIRQALMGKVNVVSLVATVSVSLVIAAIALFLTIHLFNREEVVLRV